VARATPELGAILPQVLDFQRSADLARKLLLVRFSAETQARRPSDGESFMHSDVLFHAQYGVPFWASVWLISASGLIYIAMQLSG